MDCHTVGELLPWYLNGTLEEAERGRLAAHLAGCQACQQELEEARQAAAIYAAHPAAATLVAYAEGSLAATGTGEVVARHLESCPSCTEEVAMAREGRRRLEPEAEAAPRARARVTAGPWRSRSFLPAAAAASVAALVAATGWTWSALQSSGESERVASALAAAEARVETLSADRQRLEAEGADNRRHLESLEAEMRRQLEEVGRLRQQLGQQESLVASATSPPPMLGLPILDLAPEEVYRDVERPAAAAGRRGGTLLLMLRLPRAVRAPELQLEVLDGEGRLLHRLTAPAPEGEYVPLTLPTADLPRGLVALRLSTLGEDGAAELARYRLQLE